MKRDSLIKAYYERYLEELLRCNETLDDVEHTPILPDTEFIVKTTRISDDEVFKAIDQVLIANCLSELSD